MKETFHRAFCVPGRTKLLGLAYGVLITAIFIYPFPIPLRRLELPKWVWKWSGMAVALSLFCVWLFLASKGKTRKTDLGQSFWDFVGMLLCGAILAVVFRGDTSVVNHDVVLFGGTVGLLLSLILIWRAEKKARDPQ